MKATDLYADGPAAGAKAKILLIHFDGAIDAGAAGRMAIGQLLRSLHNERVATFDADTLMDYRSHRPIVTVDNWVSSPDMVMPETVLDLVEDDMDLRTRRCGNYLFIARCPLGGSAHASHARPRAGDRRVAAAPGIRRDLESHAVPLAAVHVHADSHGTAGDRGARAARSCSVLHGGHRLPSRVLCPVDLIR